jgi:hypothetical protein
MGKHIQLSIADPCHENWDTMTAAEQGRFCASCQKQVVDFTNMSDTQLAAFFKKPSTGTVCGRFYEDQLNREMQLPEKTIPWIKYFFQFALPAFLLSARAAAQGNVIVTKAKPPVAQPSVLLLGKVSVPRVKIEPEQNISISGRVVNENDKPVPFASVMIKGTKFGMAADSTGFFSIKDLPAPTEIILGISSAGYEAKEMIISKEAGMSKDLVIQLKPVMLSEVVVSTGTYCTIRRSVVMGGASYAATVIRKPVPEPSPAEKPAMIKVYPNPVLSGTAINIGCEKLAEGYYSFQLFNSSGQQIENKQVWIDSEARIMNMEIPSVAAGIYILRLTHKESGKRFSEKVVVQ